MAKCPHCKTDLALKAGNKDNKQEVVRESEGTIKKEVMYSCPNCECIIGFAYFLGGLLTGRP